MDSRQSHWSIRETKDSEGPAEAGASASAHAIPTPRATILIAENEENNRHLMEQILKLAGYSSVLAMNGLEALHALDLERVDLVLVDLSMPVLDGYRTAERIRQHPEWARLPIVAVTAHALNGDRERALGSGFDEYLVKPFRPRDLLQLVERLLNPA
jgi:CheY-like chemotaxis protein